MEQSTLERRALAMPGVERLNDMQLAMTAGEGASGAPLTVLLAPTGSGKTLAFGLSALRRVKAGAGAPQLVVLSPSRELAVQTADVLRRLAEGCRVTALYGGHAVKEETQSLAGLPEIVVATPGRLLDHAQRGNVRLEGVAGLVVDEYDKMLELGFEDEMRRLARRMPAVKHTILTSATRLTDLPDWLPGVKGRRAELDFTAGHRRADVVEVPSPARDKLDTLVDLIRSLPAESKAIVFVNHRESAERVHERLRREKVAAGLYHGGLDQLGRENAVELLRNGSLPVLVATDLAARGLDIEAVDAVVHYHMPTSPEAWTHRNGRTARQQADGTVYVITAPEGEDRPDYITPDRSWSPDGAGEGPRPQAATLYLNLGKKDKISRGDVVGFLTAHGTVGGSDIGRIELRDHSALVAVPRDRAGALLADLAHDKIKGKRVKLSRLS